MEDHPYIAPLSGRRGSGKAGGPAHFLAPTLSLLGSVTLIIAAAQISSDRTQRIPVIFYDGPLASLMPGLLYAGLAATALGFVVGLLVLMVDGNNARSPAARACGVAIIVSVMNLFAAMVAYGALHED